MTGRIEIADITAVGEELDESQLIGIGGAANIEVIRTGSVVNGNSCGYDDIAI